MSVFTAKTFIVVSNKPGEMTEKISLTFIIHRLDFLIDIITTCVLQCAKISNFQSYLKNCSITRD